MKALFLFIVTLAAALSGCATNPMLVSCQGAPTVARTGAALVGKGYGLAMSPIPLDAVQFTTAAAADSVAVQQLSARRTPSDTVQVQARFVNCTDQPVWVSVRTSFLDRTLAPAEAPSAWQNVIMPPRATGNYDEFSTSTAQVAHYLIEISDKR